jgi:hypothetical protein
MSSGNPAITASRARYVTSESGPFPAVTPCITADANRAKYPPYLHPQVTASVRFWGLRSWLPLFGA